MVQQWCEQPAHTSVNIPLLQQDAWHNCMDWMDVCIGTRMLH